jgi:hypothetical protein
MFKRFMGANAPTPKKPKEVEQKEDEITEAMQFAVVAISQLERIRDDDPKRQQALNRVVAWIEKHRNGYKGA